LAALSQSALLSAQPVEPYWGPTGKSPGLTNVLDAEFRLTFQNAGDKVMILNLGYTVAESPPPQQLSAIRLNIADSSGRTVEVPMERIILVGGQSEDITVPLAAGETYVRQFKLGECCELRRGVVDGAGHFRIFARFEGRAQTWEGGVMRMDGQESPAAKLPGNIWIGTAQSNTAAFDLLETPYPKRP